MTNSIRRARRFSRSGVAAASVVSLALGAFSVVGPGPLASAAEEEAGEDTSLTGGIRGADGSGVINTGDQMASDLDAGSCVVQSAPSSEDGSQAGFSWVRVEPSNNTSDKRTWGVSVAFDNSQHRTFASWEWNSSSFTTAPVTLGTVPAARAGESLGTDVTASDQADEVLQIAKGFRITYGVQSVLTEEEVAKFAQADSPVRYVWKTQYNKDNISDSRLQATNLSNFLALVNPWPNENNQCAPITVDWVGIQQHVIVPGEETKVGHIDVPALSDGSVDDDSLSRMVVEAYDGNGKYIASSDTSASGGDKQLLRVDDKGDIYFTWPEYRGTDLAADKNVQFSVVAKPRTTGQLEEASASSGWYGSAAPKVFDSSNSLPRYSKANEIGRNTISLDDTEYHDPQYNTDEQTITSGIETDGSLTNQPQKVVFKQVPDLIPDLEKKKGDGGFEAKVVLDQRYVFEGWKAEMDPETYDVTVTSPSNPKPGTFAQPRVVVEYSNGSKDELSLLVIVDPNHTQITDLVRPAVAKGEANKDITSQITTKSIMNGYAPVAPATFEVDQSTVPKGWTVNVDNTGKVTATADDTVAPGTIISPKVTAKYPDGTIDEIEPQFQSIVDIKIPDYDTVTNKPGTEVSLTPKVPEVGLTGNASDEAPERYTFEDGGTVKTVKDAAGEWKLAINEKTGEITTTIPRTAPEGHILDIPVLAHYSEDSENKPQRVKGTVVVLKGDIAPVYSVESTGPNQAVDHQVQDAPEGSTFSFGKKPDGSPLTEMTTEDGWKYTIDPKTGVVTSTPPAGSKPGDKKTITVDVVTPTNDTPKVPVTTVVKLTDSWQAEPSYPAETVYPGETVTSPLAIQKPEGVEVAEENPYAIEPPKGYKATGENNQFGNPTYTVTTKNGDWIVGLDDNGNVVATAPKTAKPGDSINVPVKVTYSDKSTDDVTASIVVEDNPKRPVPFDVKYVYDDTIPAGEYKVVTEGMKGEETQHKDGTWEQTTAPTNEVVHIGTKPATASKDVTWTAPIPYSTTTRPNPALAPGETKVVQQGVSGERTYTAKFTATGDQASVVESEDAKQPVEEIIEYGPRLDYQELVTETTRKIPFETTIVYDNTLEAGTQVVDTQGVVGEETVTSTQKLVDGKPSGDPVKTTEILTSKQDAVIRVGTKTEGANTVEHTEPVPYEAKVEYDPNMPAGTYEVVTPGKAGEKTVKVTQTIVNSQVTDTKREENVTTQPVTEVIKVGTKQATATDKVEWTEPIPFSTVVRPNPDLKPGEVKTVQEGKNGEAKYTATFEGTNGQATVTESKDRTEPTDKIVEYSPTIADQTLTSTTTRPIKFETEIIFDDTLPAGEQKVDQQGENGEEKITSTQEIKDGKPVGKPSIATETKEPTKAIIRVGTKPTTTTATTTATTTEKSTTTETTRVEVPTTITTTLTSTEKVPTTVSGTPTTITETKEVPTTITTKVPTTVPTTVKETSTTTEQVPTTVKETETKSVPTTITTTLTTTEKVPTTISGTPTTITETKKVPTTITTKVPTTVPTTVKETATATSTATTTVTKEPEPVNASETVKLPFTTKIIFDDSLEPGTEVEDVKGVDGEVKVTFTDGKATAETVKEPVQRVVRVGSKPAAGVEWTEEVAYDVKVEEDPNLEAGKYVVAQQGKPGQTVHKADGTVETTEPTDHIIKVGTKNADSVDSEFKSPIPAPVVIQYDPNLPAGTVQDDPANPGVDGEKTVTVTHKMVNGQPVGEPVVTEKVITEPQPRIVKVGTKQPTAGEQVTWTEPIPFQTTFRKNPDLAPGETRVVQEGKDGEATYYVEFKANGESATVENTNQRVEPVERIVEYGPRANGDEVSSQVTRPVEFKTSVIYDDTLEEGKQVITQGELGEEVVTTTQKLVDGKPSGDPVTTTQVTKAPVNAVIRIGTKKPGTPDPAPEVSELVDLPFTTKIVYDPTLEPGQEIEDVAGANGQVKVTVVNGKATVETVKEPVQRVVRVGTKPADAEWTEEIPFKVVVRENPELTREQSRIAQEGVPGLKQVVNGNEQIVREPVDYILEVGTKEAEAEQPVYSPVALRPGQTAEVELSGGHAKGNQYRKLDWPEGWEGTVDPATGKVRVTPPADAKPGTKMKLPVEVTDASGAKATVYADVTVLDDGAAATTTPEDEKGSSEKAQRCVANAFSKNSPILWLLPVALLGAVGYGVNEAFGPQIQQASAQINEAIRRSTPDFGIGRGVEQPEWMRQINAQVDAINRQFAPVAKQLEPVGIALGVIGALALTGTLIAQACSEEGFDNGLTVLSSK